LYLKYGEHLSSCKSKAS